MPDYAHKITALRRKAADPTVGPAEAKILLDKASELEAKYGNASSPSMDDTTVISRDGWEWMKPHGATTVPPSKEAWEAVRNLHRNQHQWNKPPEEDIVEENYREEPEDEDYGYDIHEGDDW